MKSARLVLMPLLPVALAGAGEASPARSVLKDRLGPAIHIGPRRTVTLIAIPDLMVGLKRVQGWTIERQPAARPGAIGPGPGAALYVKRTKVTRPGEKCDAIGLDHIYLKAIRAHGYRLKAIRYEHFRGRPGSVNGPIRRGYQGFDARGEPVPVGALDQFVSIGLDNFVFELGAGPKLPAFCDAGYRLHLTVEGPDGIDPISGHRVTPQIVN